MDNNLAIIIEDEKDLALMFAQALADAGLRPEIFYDGGPALSRLIEVAPTIVVVDLNLPNIAGDEVIDLLKHDPRLAETKIIVASGSPIQAHAYQEVADLVLVKPVSYTQLKDLAQRLLSSSTS
ncbi:MAG: response regulator [Chloroflexi bacterium]|nr:response regulator [Chloroflexota bacterium]